MKILGFELGKPTETYSVPIVNNINYDIRTYVNVKDIREETLYSIPCVSAAINLYAGVISSLPLEIFSYDEATKSYVKDEDHPLWDLISEFVSDDTTAPEFVFSMVQQAMVNGRSIALIDRTNTSKFSLYQHYNIDFALSSDNRKIYLDGTATYDSADVIDFTWFKFKPLDTYNKLFNELLAVQHYQSELNAKSLNLVVELPPLIKGEDPKRVAEGVASTLIKEIRDGNKHNNLVVVPQGHVPKPLIDPTKYNFIEQRDALIEEVGRIYGAPPFLLGKLDSGTAANSEQQSINFLKYNIQPLLSRFEKELSLKLLGRDGSKKAFIQFNKENLLRTDLKTFMDAYSKGVSIGAISPDELRYEMNMPLKGGEAAELKPLWTTPANQTPNNIGDKPKGTNE